jgi:hypothetical protein
VTDSAGEWVEKEEELTMDRFVAVDGRRDAVGRPASSAPGGLAAERLGPGCSGLGAGRGGAGTLGKAVWDY